MYKKINRAIVEEHYAADHKFGNYWSNENSLPSLVINEKTLVFRMDFRSVFAKYALGLINFSVAKFNNMSNIADIELRMIASAHDLGSYFKPYYGITAGDQVADKLAAIFKTGIDFTTAVVEDRPWATYQIIWQEVIDQLAEYLHELNPNNWPEPLIKEMFTTMTKYWSENILARKVNDEVANSLTLENLNQLVVTGQPNHILKGYQSISDILSRGIIAQFPSQFVE